MTMRYGSLFLAIALAGCSRQDAPPKAVTEPAAAAAQPAPAPAPADSRPVIVAFGDSLTAGHGLEPGQSYGDYLQKDLDGRGLRYRVVNQGISGDTTDGGVARLESVLALRPAVVILELGANDGLRGLPLETTRANLERMIDAIQTGGGRVVLAGMTLPRNYGPDYIKGFEAIYRDLAREKKATLIPFFLEGVATNPALMQRDGLHPTAEGCRRVAGLVMKYLGPLL
jgi:acyl-CoA thioesterase-1